MSNIVTYNPAQKLFQQRNEISALTEQTSD